MGIGIRGGCLLLVSVVLAVSVLSGACSSSSSKQSFAEGMTVMCEAPHKTDIANVNPAERQRVLSEWIDKRLKNERVRKLFGSIANLGPQERNKQIKHAVKEAGLQSCGLVAFNHQPPLPIERLATVPSSHFAKISDESSLVTLDQQAVEIEGNAIVALRSGKLDSADLEGGAAGMKIPRLTEFLGNLRQARKAEGAGGSETLVVAIDRETPFRTVLAVIFSAKSKPSSYQAFQFLVSNAGAQRVLGLHLPERARAGGVRGRAGNLESEAADREVQDLMQGIDSAPEKKKRRPPKNGGGGEDLIPALEPDSAPPIQLALSITMNKVYLWSIGGEEGSLRKPRLALPFAEDRKLFDWQPVTAALREIVDRRWQSSARPAESKSIVIMADGKMPFEIVARAMAAVLGPADAPVLFPEVLFSAGFQ